MKISIEENKVSVLDTINKITYPVVIDNLKDKYDQYFKGFADGNTTSEYFYKFIYEVLRNNGIKDFVHVVDWKWDPEDLLSTFATIANNFSYDTSALTIDEETLNVSGTLEVNNTGYEMEDCNLQEFLENMNEILSNIGSDSRIFIMDYEGDNTDFCFVNNKYFSELAESGFFPYYN